MHDEISLEDLRRDHHATLSLLRSESPITWVPALDGWIVTTRELAVTVMRDATTYTVDDPRFSTSQVIGPSMLSLDGAQHARHRDPFAGAYRPSVVEARYADRIDATARTIVSSLVTKRSAELRRDLAGPLAVAVVALSLGLEEIAVDDLLGWYDHIVAAVESLSAGGSVDRTAVDAYRDLAGAVTDAISRSDSVLGEVASRLEQAEVVSNAAVFLFGGIETSEGMTANLLAHLLSNPEQMALVGDDRNLIDAAIEESLRLEPAAARVDRYATRDVEIAGRRVRRGDLVIVSLSAANRDPAAYDDPDRFDITRGNARSHLAFAHGPHACIGAHLARMEARAALGAVLDLLPGIELTEPAAVGGVVFRKPATVRIRW